MDKDDGELVRRLMTKATAMLEDAIESAVAGQSSRARTDELLDVARRLHAASREIAVIARAAETIMTTGLEGPDDSPEDTS